MDQKTIRYVIYGIIIFICVVSIILAIYTQFFKGDNSNFVGSTNLSEDGQNVNITNPEYNQEEIKEDFNQLFKNQVSLSYQKLNDIKRMDVSKPLVYSIATIKENKANQYDMNVNIPMINISHEYADKLNALTQQVFVNKVNEMMQGTKSYTVYEILYNAYINEDILSVVIKSTLKEGTNPQRVIIQSYNYDLVNNKEVTLRELLLSRGIDVNATNRKISKVITEANKQAQTLQSSGYEIYTRDVNDEVYSVDNTKVFFKGPNAEIYIMYPYGNQNYTSEMDIVVL